MKDLLFSGASVEEALAAASQALGLGAGSLRYVVLTEATPSRFGVAAAPAQIAVLLDEAGPARREALPHADSRPQPEELLGKLREVAGLQLEIAVREQDGEAQITLAGPDVSFFLEADAAVLQAMDHLMQRVAQQEGQGRLSLSCEGYREWRDEALRRRALGLAEDVLRDGQGRGTGPLNSYERRIVHLAVESVPGVTTFSVGEGSQRQVMVALATERPGAPGGVS